MKRKKIILTVIMLGLTVLSLWGEQMRKMTAREIEALRKNVVESAGSFVGKRALSVKGETFSYDCSGLMMAIMKANNISIFEKQAVKIKGANGVKIMFDTLKQYNKIFRSFLNLKEGDFIFFHNTYDKNRNRRVDDLFTHIAMAVDIQKDGTIKYVHKSSRGIEYGYMNLRLPHKDRYKDGVKNSYLRSKKSGDSRNVKYLSGELFGYFGTIFR
ncbi:MAG: C40 family peptidase [Spirochaetes bacterium]|nr:C40 family peptidase [Spirochaetota bacterium]